MTISRATDRPDIRRAHESSADAARIGADLRRFRLNIASSFVSVPTLIEQIHLANAFEVFRPVSMFALPAPAGPRASARARELSTAVPSAKNKVEIQALRAGAFTFAIL